MAEGSAEKSTPAIPDPTPAQAPTPRLPSFHAPESLRSLHYLLLAAMFGALLLATLVARELVETQEAVALRNHTQSDGVALAQSLQEMLARQLRPMLELRQRWVGRTVPPDAGLLTPPIRLQQYANYHFAAVFGAEGELRWFRPIQPGIRIRRAELVANPRWDALITAARDSQLEAIAVSPGRDQQEPVLDLAVPVLTATTRPSDAPRFPVAIARLSLQPLLHDALGRTIHDEYRCELADERAVLFVVGPADSAGKVYGHTELLRVGNATWRLRLWPNDRTIRATVGRASQLVLYAGVCAALLFTAATWQILRYRIRGSQQLRAYLAALESLNEISSAISGRLGSGGEILERLADLARQLLGMKQAGIFLLDSSGQMLELRAASGRAPAQPPWRFPLESLPASSLCVRTGQLFLVEDTERSPFPINRAVVGEFATRAVILIPLRAEDRCIGLMALADPLPRRFTDPQRRLACLLASQASVILANNRLYEQTRRDAQAKAILLQELHHRVRNNLAGIVALLSLNQADSSAETARWVESIVERIQMMARTHDLFAGGLSHVDLHQLVEQVVPSITASKPPGVLIHNQVPPGQWQFATPQAISLGMALHELCANAIQHGLQAHGTLTISSTCTGRHLCIQITDDGRGLPPELLSDARAESASSACLPPTSPLPLLAVPQRGIGLTIVRELVERELRGELLLLGRPGGGTVASIVLPSGNQHSGDLS